MRRTLWLCLRLRISCRCAGLPLEPAEITPEQRKAIEAIIHDYLMQNPDVLIDALRG